MQQRTRQRPQPCEQWRKKRRQRSESHRAVDISRRVLKSVAVVLHAPLGQRGPRAGVHLSQQRCFLFNGHEVGQQLQAGDAGLLGGQEDALG